MTQKDLIYVCQEIIDRLSKDVENPPYEYEFYNNFLRDYNIKSIAGIAKIPYLDLATALIYPDIDGETLSEVMEATQSFRSVLEDLSSHELDSINQIFSSFIRTGDGRILKSIFDNNNAAETSIKVGKIFARHMNTDEDREMLGTVKNTMDKLIMNNRKLGWDVSKLVDYYLESPIGMRNIIAIIRITKEINEDNVDYTTKEFYESHTIDQVLKVCNAIHMVKKQISDGYKRRKGKMDHEISIYKRFLRDIENAFKKDEIINYEAIVHDIEDEELKREFLMLVYEHNKLEYDKVEAINEKLTQNSLVNYLDVLKSNGIKKDEVNFDRIMRNSCEDLDKMLKILNAIIGDRKTILKIIEFSDLVSVNYFKELKSKGVLGNGAFMRYPLIFDPNSEERKSLDKSIKVINDYGVDFTLFSKFSDVLIENDKLEENLHILCTYKLLDNLNGTKRMKFLMNDDLIKKLDKIIELGYEDFLSDGLDLLNENNWDRIYVLKSMGLKPESKDELLKYLRDKKFFIPDNQLKLYMENTSEYYGNLGITYDVDIARIVADYSNTERSLCIDGVYISKNRVARNLVSRDFDTNEFFRAMITDSILSMDEIETIKSTLKNKVYKIGE